MSTIAEAYYRDLLAAYVRGSLPGIALPPTSDGILEIARSQRLEVHRFKRTAILPRVAKVLGILRGLHPRSLVDLGCGRGVFLWPLLDSFADLRVVATDILPSHLRTIVAVRRGGVRRLVAIRADMTRLPVWTRTADVVTALEVFEHLERPAEAAAEALRVAHRAVIVSVPSRPDENPEHVRLFDCESLTDLLVTAGARRVNVEYVLNHMIAVALH